MREIESIEYGLMNPEEIKELSVKRIDKVEVYDADGYPVEGGVMDPSLGVIDPGMVCRTCGKRIGDCKGHFGRIELSKPVINVLYNKKVYNLLRFTCTECKASLVKDEDKRLTKSNRATTCPECGEEMPNVNREKPYSYYVDGDKLTPEEIKEWFMEIDSEVAEELGVAGGRPEDLVLERILVPPVTMRPSITLETGERSEDDLTHKLVDIIRINQRLRNNIDIEAPDFIIEDLWELLQYHVSTLYDNTVSGIPPARHRSGRSLKSLIERVKGKEGRFRQNLIGKRANFSARTVISPDPNISINEVGVPKEIAKDMTIPVRVNEDNLEEAREWVKNGSDTYPGANYIIRPDGSKKKVSDVNKEELVEELSDGYRVERHLQDGDISLFNRQPSLHRMSIMGHVVKVLPYRTFRLNLPDCAPYNADFDGDEMNLHVPQNPEAQVEARELMKVENHIKSPKFGGPIVGMIQDHISGLFILSQEEIPREEAYDILVSVGEYDIDLPGKEMIDGKELISYFIPEDINLTIEKDPEDIVIKDGELISGIIDDDAVGDYGGELLNQLLLNTEKEKVVDFINKVSKLGIEFITRHGFSISTTDLHVSDEAREKIDEAIKEGKEDARDLISKYENGEIVPSPGETEKESFESQVIKRLREISNETEEIVRENVPLTSARIMAESGARGSMTNLALMAGLLGQETIRGERISRGYKGRTTSHFKEGELSPKAKGFVRSSMLNGLDPIESYYGNMSQREGLMDTSLRTRTSGYMYRRISNSLQDLRVEYDGTVRAADSTVVQFEAGEDGIDPSKSDRGKLVNEEV